ncbi:kinesin-related protein 8-like [Episyrphus balteatus]|uniref:kinesin-related protein 8-like n=1 Tax=Episyrphus balteatus TaxID=286459 RepID=UPI002485EC6C|nr:kinesin-related protein 8-like [Episyrphus balteatus]
MDFSFIRQNEEDYILKEDLFNTRIPKCTPEIMEENWSSSTNDILDSIFPMDFLNNLTDHQGEFGSLGGFNGHMKIEAEDYDITEPTLPEPLLSHSNVISSNSSDSGLSSDNLEADMSPPYEPLSPPSPGPSISERGGKRSPAELSPMEVIHPAKKIVCNNEHKPKVIVQKVPQVMTLSNTVQTHTSTVPLQKQQYQKLNNQQQQTVVNGIRGNEIKIVKLSPQMFTASNNKNVTIQVKNSNSGAKIQAKPGTLFLNKNKLTEMKKIVRVQNNNPRSILIPVSLQDVKELKTFKIVNTTAVRSTPVKIQETQETNIQQFPIKYISKPNVLKDVGIKDEMQEDSFIENSSDSESIIIEDGYDDEEYVHDPEVPYPKLALTSEERRLLSKEGITLPTHYPLTKHEERELKRIRRKIRNKISAQDSRKRKKEYVDGLEERVKQCTEENQSLMKRIKQLQNQNQTLMSQMKKLQSLLTKGTNKTTQPTTCLMVLLLSLALVAAPNLKLGQNPKEADLEEVVQETILQNRRNLLFNTKDQSTDVFDEEVNMSDIVSALEFNERENNAVCKTNNNAYTSSSLEEPKCKKMKLIQSNFLDDVDDDNWYLSKKNKDTTNVVSALENFQETKQNLQTSGFNIEKKIEVESINDDSQHSWLDKDILDMVSPTINGLYELNMDKITPGNYVNSPQTTVLDVTTNQMYGNQINNKQNSSEMRQIKKY